MSGWNSGVPSYISMYEYVPAKLASPPPVVVAAHYCGGSAQAFFTFSGVTDVVAAADKYGFIMIFPQTTNPATSAKCWDVGSKASLTHDGGGDTQAIAQMVQYEVTKRGADATRVYVMGASSGAMLTEAMLAVYPDVFKAGSEFSGVPAGCWSAGWSAASNWGGTCANGQDSMSAAAWGDLVRGMYPGYSGYRPRVQLWHGTADTTINYNNQTEAIKEWTNVLGLPANPTSTDTTSKQGYTIEKWQSATCGTTVLEAHTQMGGGHTTPIDATSVIAWFGLDKTGPDPQVAACGGSGAGGRSGTTGGSGGSGGAAGRAGGAAGSGGSAGRAGATGGNPGGPGGTNGSGGSVTPSGGAMGTGGTSPGATGGSSSGGPPATGGTTGGGTGGSGTGGQPSTSGAGGSPSSGGDGGSDGCSCATAPGVPGGGIICLALAALLVRRRRARR
ncbi:MAG TPA: PHB depolymerase family esterase [Polyangia bacterium]|nr:PHB depolymerase family esterase [Polyangia bacterium]